jgi:hypothetical protein
VTKKVKCEALTKAGRQCNREAVGSRYCWQHLKERERIIKDLRENNTIELLEEKGKINIDYIDEDLGMLIEVLEAEFNIETEIQNLIGGQYLVYLSK